MKEALTKVLQEEEAAAKRLAAARQEAERLILEARKKAAAWAADTNARTAAAAASRRDESVRGFQAEKNRILEETREQAARQRERNEGTIPGKAHRVFTRIIGVEG